MSIQNNTPNLSSRLNKRITMEENNTTPDGSGGFISSWTEFASVWAEIEPIKYEENFISGQVQNKATHSITIRYINSLKPSMRINYSNRIFNIVSVFNHMEQNQVITIIAEEQI